MHENWCRVQTQHLEHIRTFIEIDHSEKQLVAVRTRVPVRISRYGKLIVSMTTNDTLSSRSLNQSKSTVNSLNKLMVV